MRKRILTAVVVGLVLGFGCGTTPQPTAMLTPAITLAPSKPAPVVTSRPTVTPVPPTPALTLTPTPIPPTLAPTVLPTPFPKSRADWMSYTNSNNVTGVVFDGDGYLWATSGGGVVRWSLADGTYEKYTSEDGLPDHTVTSVAAAPDGTLWFGTLSGAVHFDRQAASAGDAPDEVWEIYAWADGLPSNGSRLSAWPQVLMARCGSAPPMLVSHTLMGRRGRPTRPTMGWWITMLPALR